MTKMFSKKKLAEIVEYLDELRESGVTNMFGAASYMVRELDMPLEMAQRALGLWMHNFSKGTMSERVAAALIEQATKA